MQGWKYKTYFTGITRRIWVATPNTPLILSQINEKQTMTNSWIIWRKKQILSSKVYPEPCQTSKMELFAKIINSFQPLTIILKSFILDVWHGYEYASTSGGEYWVSDNIFFH